MKKFAVISKISQLPVPPVTSGEVQVVLKLVTVLAAIHLANKVDKIIDKVNKTDRATEIISMLK